METVNEYPCSQKDALSVLETVWDNYSLYLTPLSNYKPSKYTAALAGEAKTRIAAARALPDFQARSGLAEELAIDVRKKAALCMNDFQLLKGYIDEAFNGDDADLRKPNYEEAGQLYYRDSARGDWESVQSLGDSMKGYIASKLGLLTTTGMMPATFQGEVDARKGNFEKVYSEFKVAEQTQVATAEKVQAINACYREGVDMMKDAQRVYANEPEVRTMFVFTTLLDMINPKTAGVRGKLQDADTHEPLAGAMLTFTPENEPAIVVTADEDGEYASLQMRAQLYKVKVEMPGYVLVEDEVAVEGGTVTVRNYRLKTSS